MYEKVFGTDEGGIVKEKFGGVIWATQTHSKNRFFLRQNPFFGGIVCVAHMKECKRMRASVTNLRIRCGNKIRFYVQKRIYYNSVISVYTK